MLTLEIRGPSRSAEALAVLRTGGLVLLLAALWSGRAAMVRASKPESDLAPFQVLFRNLGASEQRSFRSIQEGITEAENVRGNGRSWPTPQQLAEEGVPPFAPVVNYLGRSSKADEPAFLVLIQEPEPGFPGDPPDTPVDEIHHRLRNGMLLHVSVWMSDVDPGADVGLVSRPYEGGWRQIIVGAQTPARE